MNASLFAVYTLLVALFPLARSAGLNKPQIKKDAQNIIVRGGEDLNLDRTKLGCLFGIIFKAPRDKSVLDRTFKDLKIDNVVLEERIMDHCEALGHLLHEKYFQPFNLKLDEIEISNLFRQHSSGTENLSYDNFKKFVPKVYPTGVDPLGDQVRTWHKAMNLDDQVVLQEIIDLCKNTAHFLRKNLIV